MEFSKSLFLVVPTFSNDNKKSIESLDGSLAGQNFDTKKRRSSELLMNLLAEYDSNIDVLISNLSTPIKFNLVPFQLYHITSSKFLSMTETDMTGESVRLCLVDRPSQKTIFKFTNSLKY